MASVLQFNPRDVDLNDAYQPDGEAHLNSQMDEIRARILSDVFQQLSGGGDGMDYATRRDLKELKTELKGDIGDLKSEMASMSAKLDNIPTQLELVRSNAKNDMHELMKEQKSEMKNDARYRTTITIAAIGLIVALIQAAPAIFSAMTSAP